MAPDDPLELDRGIPFEEILAAIRTRDNAVRTRVVERLTPRVTQAIQRAFGSRSVRTLSVEDAVQSSYRTVFRRLEKGEFDLRDWNALTGLLIRVAWHKARKHLRQTREILLPALSGEDQQPGEELVEGPQDGNPLQKILREEMLTQVRHAVKEVLRFLPEADAIIFRGKLDGKSVEQIIADLASAGLRYATRSVVRRWATIQESLRNRLAEYEDAD